MVVLERGEPCEEALLGSLILGAGYFALLLISKGFGFGDVKLALVLGAVLGRYGWAIVLIGTFARYLLGALYGIAPHPRGPGWPEDQDPVRPVPARRDVRRCAPGLLRSLNPGRRRGVRPVAYRLLRRLEPITRVQGRRSRPAAGRRVAPSANEVEPSRGDFTPETERAEDGYGTVDSGLARHSPLPSWLPRNGAPGLRSWHDFLPLSNAWPGGWCHRLRGHRKTADWGHDHRLLRRSGGSS